MDNFVWTDEAVKSFTQLYSGNFQSIHVDSRFNCADYRGKKLQQKMEQFKKDYKINLEG